MLQIFKNRLLRLILHYVLILSLLFLALFILLILSVRMGVFGKIPSKKELENIQHSTASQIYSSDQVLLGTYFYENRTQVELNRLPAHFTNALLAIEDIRFYDHNGLDRRSVIRVLVKSLLLGKDTGGGSTITQQLVKNLFPRQHKNNFGLLTIKIREIIIAKRLERVYSKDEIIELYINTVSFGEDTYGIETAALRFFNTIPDSLTITQSATLTGLLKATTFYNPRINPERALNRRNLVIRQMEKYDMISHETANELISFPLELDYKLITHTEGLAPYFREHLRLELLSLLDTLTDENGQKYNLYSDGLKILTTIDSRIQEAAENAVATQMKQLQKSFEQNRKNRPVFGKNDPVIVRIWKNSAHHERLKTRGLSDDEIEKIFHSPSPSYVFTWEGEIEMNLSPHDSIMHYMMFLNSGFIAIEPENGHILAWVGGINSRYFKFDHVKSRRQTGSAFKPVIYAAAIENANQPCDWYQNKLTTYKEYKNWTPRNHDNEYGGFYSMQSALANSINTITVELLMSTGIDNTIKMSERLGIKSELPEEPSIALGTAEMSLLELTTAYTAFLNKGMPAKTWHIKAIYNSKNELIYEFEDPNVDMDESKAAMSQATAAALVKMMAKVVNEGTGIALRSRFNINHALAGKTGTTQNNTDGWFIGMTPDMVFGAWTGGWDTRVRFTDGQLGSGSRTALPVCGYFLNNLNEYPDLKIENTQFYPHQWETTFNTNCPDYRDENIFDHVKGFFKNIFESDKTIKKNDEKRSFWDRLRGD